MFMKQYKSQSLCALVLILVLILSGCGSLLTMADHSTAKEAIGKMDLLLSGNYDPAAEETILKDLESAALALSASAIMKESKARSAEHNKAKLYEKAHYPQMAADTIEQFITSWTVYKSKEQCQKLVDELRAWA